MWKFSRFFYIPVAVGLGPVVTARLDWDIFGLLKYSTLMRLHYINHVSCV